MRSLRSSMLHTPGICCTTSAIDSFSKDMVGCVQNKSIIFENVGINIYAVSSVNLYNRIFRDSVKQFTESSLIQKTYIQGQVDLVCLMCPSYRSFKV
jgi:hypothetical protein